ncbi:DUF4221 domain-containing protein [Polaribacter litorisediminis]|uniref:DUF4221 family protein n=1 Tax=Polaribacter litorisediminis TaxID=1908341 RepID=UPI001CBB6D4D|nr:DUF4221 family protein [Polaribacter litorisediminis]UAM98036.1 DUF4221 domain-containing protein [Polaribacter litorisediminis]
MKILKIILLLFFFGCQNKKNTDNIMLIEDETIVMEIDNDTHYKSFLNYVIEINGSTFLYRKGSYQNTLDIYDLKKKERIKKIVFADEGPDRINNFDMAAFYPLSKDLNFIGSYFSNVYFTKENKIIKSDRIETSQEKSNSNLFFMMSWNDAKVSLYNEKLYVNLFAYDGKPPTDEFYSSKILMEYNLKNDSVRKMNISFPKDYFDKCWENDYYYRSYTQNNKGELIYLFGITPKLFKFSLEENRIVSEHNFKSKFINTNVKNGCSSSFEEMMSNLLTQHRYKSIIYNKYENLYYLITILPVKRESLNNTKPSNQLSPFSISILNSDLVKISETKFTGSVYNYYDYFLTKKGLWMSKNNELNEEFNENKLVFSLLKIVENKK